MKQKYSFEWWAAERQRAVKDRETFVETANRSVKIYRGEHKFDDCERRMNVWWSLVNTLIPACFSRIPKVDVSLRKRQGSLIHQLSGVAWERATQYAIEEHFDFKRVGYDALLQYFLTGQAVLWGRYEGRTENKPYRLVLTEGDDGLYNEKGERYEGDLAAVERVDSGFYVASEVVPTKVSEKAILDSVHYKDFLTSCARNDTEVYWKAKRAYLDREAVIKLFGKDIADAANYNVYPEEHDKDPSKEKREFEGKSEWWELYCGETDKVYWQHDQGKQKILEAGDAPIKFSSGWPCVELKANIEPNSNVPFGDFKECEDLILEVERLTTRIHATVQAIRSNMLYDSTMGEQIEEILTGDLKMIPAKMSSAQRGKGGLAGAVQPLPVDVYIKVLEVLVASRNEALQKLNDSIGSSDLVRGASAPMKTATANQLEANFTNLRFMVRRECVVEFLTGGIKLVGEIIAEEFSPETIYEMSYGEELITQLPQPQPMPGMAPPPPVDPLTQFQPIIDVLKNERERSFRLDIESDSIVELDQRADREERKDAVASIGGFLQQMEPMIEKYPAAAEFSGNMIKFVIRSYKAGKEIEGDILSTFQSMVQAAQQRAQQQPPDPKIIESQTRLQIAQMEGQTKQTVAQAQVQESMARTQAEMAKVQTAREEAMNRMALDIEAAKRDMIKLQADIEIRMRELDIKEQTLVATAAQKAADSEIAERFQAIDKALDAMRVENEKKEVQLVAYEKLLEERRLALQQLGESRQAEPHTFNIVVEGAKPAKRTAKISRSDGTQSIGEVDD